MSDLDLSLLLVAAVFLFAILGWIGAAPRLEMAQERWAGGPGDGGWSGPPARMSFGPQRVRAPITVLRALFARSCSRMVDRWASESFGSSVRIALAVRVS